MTHSEFNREFQSIESYLFSFALKLTKNYHHAQDLCQDAASRAFIYRDRFTMGTNFRAWMSTILHHTFINHCRKAKTRCSTVNESIETFRHALENKTIVSNQGEMKMEIDEIMHVLHQLKELYRTPFLMHYRGYEYQEIASELDLLMGTVKSRLHTARVKLRKMLRHREN